MKRTMLFLAVLFISTTGCGRIAEQALRLVSSEDETVVETDEGSVQIGSDTASARPGAPTSVRVEGDGTTVKVGDGEKAEPSDGKRVVVNDDGTKVRTDGSNVDVETEDGDKVKVRDGAGGTRVEVGGVKVEGDKVTVPGVATVYGY